MTVQYVLGQSLGSSLNSKPVQNVTFYCSIAFMLFVYDSLVLLHSVQCSIQYLYDHYYDY